jgi:transposase
MLHQLSNDLRERVVAYIEAGHWRHEAAAHFDTSVSFAVNLMKLWRETGSVDPRPRGGFLHGKLKPHRAFILETVTARGDITMPELAKELRTAKDLEVTASALSKFLISCGFSFKKNPQSKRTRPP